jgi:ADP-ribose pyrophosphatase YjhB (NUDIX family)
MITAVLILIFIAVLIVTVLIYEERLSKLRAEKAEVENLYPYPVAFHTVDMACVKEDKDGNWQVALGQKSYELTTGLWRFPGGFVDPEKDNSAEDAASRELDEEVPGVKTTAPRYIGSLKTNDTRYRERKDKIITSFFVMNHLYGELQAGDDLAAVKWMPVSIEHLVDVNPIHQKLFMDLIRENQNVKDRTKVKTVNESYK